eukprot:454839-Hanusia_phi.AAC.9
MSENPNLRCRLRRCSYLFRHLRLDKRVQDTITAQTNQSPPCKALPHVHQLHRVPACDQCEAPQNCSKVVCTLSLGGAGSKLASLFQTSGSISVGLGNLTLKGVDVNMGRVKQESSREVNEEIALVELVALYRHPFPLWIKSHQNDRRCRDQQLQHSLVHTPTSQVA